MKGWINGQVALSRINDIPKWCDCEESNKDTIYKGIDKVKENHKKKWSILGPTTARAGTISRSEGTRRDSSSQSPKESLQGKSSRQEVSSIMTFSRGYIQPEVTWHDGSWRSKCPEGTLLLSSSLLLMLLTGQTHQTPEGKGAHDAINTVNFPRHRAGWRGDLEEQMETINYLGHSFFPRTEPLAAS